VINSAMDRLESVEGECSYVCDCMRLGTLGKALKKVRSLYSGREPPFSGISFTSLQMGIRNIRKVILPLELKEETAKTVPLLLLHTRRHEYRYAERINIEIEGIGQGIRGLGFEDTK